ncbi:MAG: hypothetical protein IT372_40135 [Polyangiaceae bacterium]|nr:hypothetical protein [Polyangiaceae bacterium]
MENVQMIARAWLDEGYRASLVAQGIDVPSRPDDLIDDRLDVLADPAGEHFEAAVPSGFSPCYVR